MDGEVWESIVDSLEVGDRLRLLSPSPRSQPFEIDEIEPNHINIKFLDSGTSLKLGRGRFVSAYKILREHRGDWVKIGASRVGTDYGTLEGRIKGDFSGSVVIWMARQLQVG